MEWLLDCHHSNNYVVLADICFVALSLHLSYVLQISDY